MSDAWDGRPQNPERDGAHVVQFSYGTDKAGLVLHNPPLQAWWIATKRAWQFGGERWHRSTNWMRDNRAVYLGPCITPAERDALAARVAQVEPALKVAVAMLSCREPGDSRAVSDEFVALAAVECGCADAECMRVIDTALAAWRAANEAGDG